MYHQPLMVIPYARPAGSSRFPAVVHQQVRGSCPTSFKAATGVVWCCVHHMQQQQQPATSARKLPDMQLLYLCQHSTMLSPLQGPLPTL
jgi:hypothetical protein